MIKDLGRASSWVGAVVVCASMGGCLGVDGPSGTGVSGPVTEYALDRLTLPTNSTTANALSFDLDGTGLANDNALGSVIGLLSGFGFDLQPAVDASIASGDVVILSAIQGQSFSSGAASWQVYLGEPAAAPPAFDGTDTFVRDATGPNNALMVGTITAGRFVGGPANVQLLLGFGGPQGFILVELVGARIQASVSATGASNGILGGAITREDVETQIIPAIATVMTDVMVTDCPCADPGPPACVEDTAGDAIDAMFNGTHDCVVTAAELLANPLVQTGTEPDVDMFDGTTFAPGVDGEPDSLSLGLGFTAVPATFDRPGE